jgi:general stress protein 26
MYKEITMSTIDTIASPAVSFDLDRQRAIVKQTIARKSFCTLATSSASHRSHVAGVLYVEVDGLLYMNVSSTSVKARNIRENPRVAVCIPIRKVPVGPPYTVQFQGTAEIVSPEDPSVADLVASGRLKRILPHGVADDPDSCFLRITLGRRVTSYGLGVSLLKIIREPLSGIRSVEL